MIDTPIHPIAAFWLDVADKLLKALAVFVAAAWTWMNFRRSRTYAEKLDLQLAGDVFFSKGLYVDVTVTLTNLGAAKHFLKPEGTSCEMLLVHSDLQEESVRIFPVFKLHTQIEPGESIGDHVLWRIPTPPADCIWLKVNLRVVSGSVEWNRTLVVRLDHDAARA
jgi:hypothetical protein